MKLMLSFTATRTRMRCDPWL